MSCSFLQFAVVTFTVYTVTSGEPLTPQVAFVTLTLINNMTRSMTLLPMGIANMVQVSCASRDCSVAFKYTIPSEDDRNMLQTYKKALLLKLI